MAKIKKIEPIIKRETEQPTRRLNLFQKGIRNISRFIRPVKPEVIISVPDTQDDETTATDPGETTVTTPDETTASDPIENTASDPDETNETTVPDPGQTTTTDPTGSSSGSDPVADPTNPVNTDDMEPFIGEIRMFAGNYAPRGWALCDGQTLDIASHTQLYSILGATYGGDGRTNFKLPDLRGRVPVHQGQGPGLSNNHLGMMGGAEKVSLTVNEMPKHSHTVMSSDDPADIPTPMNNLLSAGDHNHYSHTNPGSAMHPQMISDAGGGMEHNNMQPYLVINYIIALVGIHPSRT